MTSISFAAYFLTLTTVVLSYPGINTRDLRYATCTMTGCRGSVLGTVDFRQVRGYDIEIMVNLTGLTPNSKHGFHIHTYGDIRASCGDTAGHFNPSDDTHASPNARKRHAGDLGNIEADAAGNHSSIFTDRKVKLHHNTKRILGRAVVVHALEDDLGQGGNPGSLTTGNAGARIGCCVIGFSEGKEWENRVPSHLLP